MDATEFNSALKAEIDASFARLTDDAVIDRFSKMPNDALARLFDERVSAFRQPNTS
jgi:hypothetical protein